MIEDGPTIYIHDATGPMHAIEYWALREIVSEAKRSLPRNSLRRNQCEQLEKHLVDNTSWLR